MTTATTSQSPPSPPAVLDMHSLADLLTRILADPALPPQRARDHASSLRRFGGTVGRDLAAIPASFDALRPLIASVHPAAHGLSLKRWQNIRSAVSTLLRHYGATATALSRKLGRAACFDFPTGSRRGGRGLPVGPGLRPEGAQGTAGDQVALEVEAVVDGGVQGNEALRGRGRFEPLHLALSSPHRLV